MVLKAPVFMFLVSRMGSSAYLEALVSGQSSFLFAFDAPFLLVLASHGVATLASAPWALWAAGLLEAVGGAVSSCLVVTAPPVRDYKPRRSWPTRNSQWRSTGRMAARARFQRSPTR